MFTRSLTCFLLLLFGGDCLAENISYSRPNILVIISDNHSTQYLHSSENLGIRVNPTPTLTKLAQTGYSHKLAYCSNSSSSKFFSYILGSDTISPNHDLSKDNSKLIGHHFNSLGYDTAFFGSWKGNLHPKQIGFQTSFQLEDPEIFFNPKIINNQDIFLFEGHTTDVITEQALHWIQQDHERSKPFFIIISYQATKRPWMPPIRTINLYNDKWFDVPDSFFSDFTQRTPANRYQRMNIAQDLDLMNDLFLGTSTETDPSDQNPSILAKNIKSMNDEQRSAWWLSWKPQNEAFSRESKSEQSNAVWKFQRYIKNYLRCLFAMDENVERLLNTLNSSTVEDFRLIYTSKKGNFCGEFGWFGSEWMYEPSSKIPLIVYDPLGTSKKNLDGQQIISGKKIYQLIKNLVESHSTLGPTRSSKIKNASSQNNFHYYTNDDFPGTYHVSPHHGLRKGHFKIIHYYPFNEWEFYNLNDDPAEETNLFSNDSHQEIIKEYKSLLLNHAASVKSHSLRTVFSESWKREQRAPNRRSR